MWGRNLRELPPKKSISIQDLRRIMLIFSQNLNKISAGSSQDLCRIIGWVMVLMERWSRFYHSTLPCGVEECTLCMIDAPHFV